MTITLPIPSEGKTLHTEPLIHVMDDVLSQEECAHIISVAEPHMKRGVVSSAEGGVESAGRTGSVHWVKHNTTPIVQGIIDRISTIVGVPTSHAESLQVIYYGETQQYKPHFDAYDLNSESGKRCTANGGQRLVTALIYLNDVQGGGGTIFPKAEQQVSSSQGRMVVFHNCYEGTNERHPHSLHGGMPVEAGEKWACNLWYRESEKT